MDLFRHLKAGSAGGREEGPIVAERALDGSRYRVHTEPNGTEEVAEEARGRWWERMARCVLTSSLGAPSCEERRRKVAALLLLRRGPYRCSRSVADAAAATCRSATSPVAITSDDNRVPRRAPTETGPPHDPASLPTLLYCFARVIARPELSSALETAARECNMKRLLRMSGYIWQGCRSLILIILNGILYKMIRMLHSRIYYWETDNNAAAILCSKIDRCW